MTIEEKMFHLQTAAMEEARAEGNALIRQHEEALNSVFSQHCEEARRQSETRIKAEKVSAAQQLNMASSKAQLEMTIYINPSDADKKEYLEEHTGMRVTVSKEDFKGGIRAVLRQRNILIDHAFKGALEREYQQFLFRGGVEGA